MTAVSLREWEVSSPQPGGALYETYLSDEAGRKFASELTKTGRLGILELAQGLELRATSFVGRISLGGLIVTVRPKIADPALLRLFRYAYGLRNVHLYDSVRYGSAEPIFQDLLIHQLLAETRELLERGIQREYERAHGELANPRGRIDFAKYAKQPNPARAALPCVFHPRTEDTLLNQVLLAGLELASRMTVDGILKSDARHLSKMLSAGVRTVQLNLWILKQAFRNLDRRTSAYKPAFEVIQILLEGSGVSLDEGLPRTRLPGFLFDMNRFFQKLISRFLHEHLTDVEVRDEFRLKEMFSYDPAHNPLRRGNPIVRPDFVLVRAGETVSVLDAKYRDLWDQPLPRDMLYQLSLYALGRTGGDRRSVILYPALEASAREQRIRIREPSAGASQASVILRPVGLGRLCELIEGGPTMRAKATDYAVQLALR